VTVTQDGTTDSPWVKSLGGTSSDLGYSVVVDDGGNVIVTGSFQGTVNLGGSNLISAGSSDIFLAKFSPAGQHLWSTSFGGSSGDFPETVATAPNGDVLLVGRFQNTMTVGATSMTSAGNYDIFVARFSSTGAAQWARRYGSTLADLAASVASDSAGNAIVTGYFRGTVNFGGSNLVTPFDGLDTFLLKLSVTGAHLWSKNFGSTSDDRGMGVAVDINDDILLTGYYLGQVNFGGTGLNSAGDHDVYLAKFRADGSHVWSKRLGGMFNDIAAKVAVDGMGNVVASGYFWMSTDMEGGTLSATAYGMYVAKYNGNGVHQWSRASTGGGYHYATGVVCDEGGNVVVVGYYQYAMSLGTSALEYADMAYNGFVAKYTSNGGLVWVDEVAGTGSDAVNAVSVSAAGFPVVTGYFQGTASFAGSSLTSTGSNDAFLLKIAP
jgi:hypothetical protein